MTQNIMAIAGQERPASLRSVLLKPGVRWLLGGALRAPTMAQRRTRLERAAAATQFGLPRGSQFSAATLGGVPVEWVRNTRHGERGTLVYFHGGGYAIGSPRAYRNLTAQLARRCGMAVLAPDYRLAPEHPFPAAPEDALAVYRALLDQGRPAAQIVLAGDSAGGGLALACALWAKAAGLPLPAGLVLFSPFTDLTLSGASVTRCEGSECVLSRAVLDECVAAYLNGYAGQDPLASPLFADLSGLPPMLIQATDTEMLYDDAARLAASALRQGLEVQAENWPGLWHVWQAMAGTLPEANRALDRVAHFVRAKMNP